jgi:hypothetical protein
MGFILDLLKKTIRHPLLVTARCPKTRDPAISVVSSNRSDLCALADTFSAGR